MAIGQIIRATKHASSPTDTSYYSPWFPAGGNQAVFTCDVIAAQGLNYFKITVQTKNSEESDKDQNSFVPSGGGATTITISPVNSQTRWEVGAGLGSGNNGFLELVRFKYTIKSNAAANGWVHFRMLDPQWLTN